MLALEPKWFPHLANGTYNRDELIELIKSRGISPKKNGPLGSFTSKLHKPELSIKEVDTILKSLDNRTKDTLQRLVDDNLAVAHWEDFCKDVKSMFNSVLGKVHEILYLKTQ